MSVSIDRYNHFVGTVNLILKEHQGLFKAHEELIDSLEKRIEKLERKKEE